MTTLRQGDRGPAVLELQLLLSVTGHDPGPLDGVFGPKTLDACITYLHAEREIDAEFLEMEGEIDALRAAPRRAVELPRILTPIAAVDMRIALAAAYHATDPLGAGYEHAEDIPGVGNAVRVALAQLAMEHGHQPWGHEVEKEAHDIGLLPPEWSRPKLGESAYLWVWNFNVGNRQVRREDREQTRELVTGGIPARPIGWTEPRVGEPVAPWFSMSPVEGSGAAAHKATSAHYAYPNAAEGAAAYWAFLRDHCADALAAFERGDPAGAAHELKHCAWSYSGDEAAYARVMVDIFARTA